MSSKFPRPKAKPPQDTTDTVTADDLAAARVRWGLDAVPLKEERVVVKETPDVFARSLLAKPVPKEWEDRLRAMSPKTDTHSWLLLTWMAKPGHPNTGRWVLYECVPANLVPTEMVTRLSGAPYWEIPKEERPGREALVSPHQWLLWRQHQVWARPFWILQGNDGGTPMAYSELEQKYLKMAGQPTVAPALGALPYAPFDSRVERAILRRDRLVKAGGSIANLRRAATSEEMKRETEEAEKQYRKAFLQWWGDRLKPQSEFLEWYTRRTEADRTLTRQTRAEFYAAQQLEDEYVETGLIPVVREEHNR